MPETRTIIRWLLQPSKDAPAHVRTELVPGATAAWPPGTARLADEECHYVSTDGATYFISSVSVDNNISNGVQSLRRKPT